MPDRERLKEGLLTILLEESKDLWEVEEVRHDGSIPSTFRSRSDLTPLFERNKARLWSKWNRPVPIRWAR